MAWHVLGCLLQQVDANPGGSGEGELAQPRVLQDGVRDGVVTTGDDIDDPGGKTGVDEGLGEEQGGQRGGRGRADDHRAAGGKSRGDLAGGHGQREVPRGDEQARADGPLGDELADLALREQAVVTANAHCLLGEPAQELPAVGDLSVGLGQRLAHLEGHELGEVVLALGDELEGLAQDLAALTRGGVGPGFLGTDGGVEGVGALVDGRIGDGDE